MAFSTEKFLPTLSLENDDRRRFASLLVGGTLTFAALFQRGAIRPLLGLAGGWLVARGVRGSSLKAFKRPSPTEERQGRQAVLKASRSLRIDIATTVFSAAEPVYRRARDFGKLAGIAPHFKSVDTLDDRRYHIVAEYFGQRADWDVEIFNEIPNELIAWRSMPGSPIALAGTVRLQPAPGGRGTEARMTLELEPQTPAGVALFSLIGRFQEHSMRETMRRMKQLIEAGEMAVGISNFRRFAREMALQGRKAQTQPMVERFETKGARR